MQEGSQHRSEDLPSLWRGEAGSSLAKRTEHRRVLKPTGSIYLHCDPTAGHYLRMLLDAVFGPENFRTEISWKRSSAHSDTKQGRKQHSLEAL